MGTYYNMSESQNHYTNGKKPDTKDVTLYGNIYTKFLERQIYIKSKRIGNCLGWGTDYKPVQATAE